MPKIEQFYFPVEIELEITRAEVEHIRECSARHYDGKCKSASLQGGFVYGWRNRFDWYSEGGKEKTPTNKDLNAKATVHATRHEIDLTCKILESESVRYQKPGGIQLHQKMQDILEQMREESKKVNYAYIILEPGQKACPECYDVMSYSPDEDPGWHCFECGYAEYDRDQAAETSG